MPILEINWKRAFLIHILSFFEMLLSPSGDIIKVTLSKPEQLDFAYVYMSSIVYNVVYTDRHKSTHRRDTRLLESKVD